MLNTIQNNQIQTSWQLAQASIDSLTQAIQSGRSEALFTYLQTMAKFPTYSARNVLLIAAQRPTATHLEGVRSWRDLGRSVRPGEKGIRIFAPMVGIKPDSQNESQDISKNSRKRKKPEPETLLLGFRAVSVFDIAQTGGEALPESRHPVDVAEKLEKLTAFAQAHGMTIEYVDWLTEKKGNSYRGTIRLLPNMPPAESFPVLLREVASQLQKWNKQRPSSRPTLRAYAGLLRDCPIVPTDASAPNRRLKVSELKDPALRCNYLASSAYLELTSVDIISDMIVQVHRVHPVDSWKLTVELGMQLLDECRHAELLAARVRELGFEMGVVPIDLHTWDLYNSFHTLHEKLIMQQVVQEGYGLDSSAINVGKLKRAGDHVTAELYVQIAADECNHVKLGLRWAKQLAPEEELSLLIQRVSDTAERLAKRPTINIIPELRKACGYPPEWITREARRCGSRSMKTILKHFKS